MISHLSFEHRPVTFKNSMSLILLHARSCPPTSYCPYILQHVMLTAQTLYLF